MKVFKTHSQTYYECDTWLRLKRNVRAAKFYKKHKFEADLHNISFLKDFHLFAFSRISTNILNINTL